MRQTLQSSAAAAAIALALAPAAATASSSGIVFPPPGSNAFIQLYEVDSGQLVCHPLCGLAASPVAPLGSNFSGSGNGGFINASGEIGPTAIHSLVSAAHAAAEYDLAMHDTYTVHGGGGPFALTATMHATGTAESRASGGPFQGIFGIVGLTIGTFDIDPLSTGIPIVHPFDPSTHKSSGLLSQFAFGSTPFTVPLDVMVTYTRMVNAGDVFDLGYEMSTDVQFGSFDLSHTAVISFDTPEGVFLTSALGGTFGAPPSAGVPEPAGWALMIAGVGLAGSALRRRPRRAVTA